LVTVRTWHIEDDGGFVAIFLLIDGGESAEELVGDVGEDGGAAGGDFVLSEEEKQAGEKIVDLDRGAEVVEVSGEGGGDFGGVVVIRRKRSVGGAEVGVDVGGVETAAPAVGIEIDATSSVVDEAGFSGLLVHFSVPLKDRIRKKQGATQKILKTRELRKKQFVS
jgi:hypothetical protein